MIQVSSDGLQVLRDELAAMQVNVKKEMRIAAWKAQKKSRRAVAKRLSETIKQPVKRLMGASYAKMLSEDNGFLFVIREKFRIAIKRFKPKHTKTGVLVKIAGVETTHPHAFMGAKPGKKAAKLRGAAVQRVTEKRLPIRVLPAVKPVDVIKGIGGMVNEIGESLKTEYRAQVVERIRFLKVKLAGKLRNQKT